jgi:hypothetical protein
MARRRLRSADVRESSRGREDTQTILTLASLAFPGEVFSVRTWMEPQWLYPVLESRGLDHWAEDAGALGWNLFLHRRP